MFVPWRGTRAAMVLVAMALSLPACGDDGDPTMETGADGGATTDCAPDELPQLHVVNQTGNAVEEITMLACDMSDMSSYPVPPGGLPTGGELTIPLPGPGCWVLQYSGEGCLSDTPGMVEAAACETVEWLLDENNHACAGG